MTALTAHFTLEELDGVGPIPPAILANLRRTAELLEAVRAGVGGVPLQVTNGYDSPTVADPPGRVPNSQHKDGTAADFIPRGISLLEFHRRFTAAEARGEIPPYGQLIYYPFQLIGAGSGHIHISLATRGKVRERLVRLNEHEPTSAGQKYTTLSSTILARFPGGAAGAGGTIVVLLLIALAGVLLLFPGGLRHG